jgi:hypothetical protein
VVLGSNPSGITRKENPVIERLTGFFVVSELQEPYEFAKLW